jgi:3-oxoacyl-[acyl-carrier-protein] synthase-3
MQTDSEALLHAGVRLAGETWTAFLDTLGWGLDSISKVVTHQVGKVHRKMLLERLGLNPLLDFPTVEFLGNTGAVALPMTAALGEAAGHVQPGDRVAWLGIGSGLSSVMLGTEW